MIDIKVDARAVTQALDQLEPKASRSALTKATKAGAMYLKPKVKAATPKGKTGRLRRSISVSGAKRQKPGAVVRFRPKVAPHRHLVIGGTRPHSTKPVRVGKSPVQAFTAEGALRFSRGHRHPGSRPNPIIDRVATQHGNEALDVAERELLRLLDL